MDASKLRFVVAAAFAAWAGSVAAVALPSNGSQVALPGTSAAAQPNLAGTVVRDLVTPFSYTILDDNCEECTIRYDLSGTLQSRVVKSVDGTFDFYWRITTQPILEWTIRSSEPDRVLPAPPGFTADLSWAALSGFSTSAYRADWRSDGLGSAAPRTAALTADGPIFYFSERFDFDGEGSIAVVNSTLKSGGESRFFFLDTDAHNYAANATMRLESFEREPFQISGGYASLDPAQIATFGPAPIPEPQTWALMLVGLAGVAGAARRYRRR